MEQLLPLVRAYSVAPDPALSESPTLIAKGLAEKKWKLIDIVKSLGESLVAEDDAIRSRGVSLLSETVAQMDRTALDRQSTKTLTTFFVDKLGDKSSMLSCASALTALTESPSFGTGEGVEVIKGIFTSVDLQTYPQASRFLIYQLVDSLMSRSRNALKRLGKDFVKGYCSLVEGEKDPRNLMLSFGLIKVILLEFEIEGSVEDLFDITFCYFPITFNPPKDDPYGITSDDLIVALRACLSATSLFGKLALPLFLDKMQASSEKAKRQTLQALTECFPIYGAEVCGEWAGRFSEGLSIEVFHATDPSMMDLALKAFRALYSTLYPDTSPISITSTTIHAADTEGDAIMSSAETESTTPKRIEGIATKVVQNSLDELKEPDKSNAKPAVRILNALICSSNRLASYILATTVPFLLSIFKDPDEIALRAPVLVCLAELLSSLSMDVSPVGPTASLAPADSTALTFPPPTLSHADGASPLEPFRDDLLSVLTSGSRSTTCITPAIEGLVALVRIPDFLSSSEVTYCVSSLDDVLIGASDLDTSSSSTSSTLTEDDYENALDGLVTVASLHPRTIESSTLPKLFERLPSSVDSVPDPKSPLSTRYRRALEALACLCGTHPDLFEILSVRLIARLESILNDDRRALGISSASLYAHHLLTTLRAVLLTKVERAHQDVAKYVEKFLPRLIGDFILPTLKSRTTKEDAVTDVRLLNDVANIVGVIVQKLDSNRQTKFTEDVIKAFHDHQLEGLLGEPFKKDQSIDLQFDPLGEGPTIQRNLAAIYSACLIPIKPTVPLPIDLISLVKGLIDRSLKAENRIQQYANLHLLASLINKRYPSLNEWFDAELPSLWSTRIINPESPNRIQALKVWTWVTKGLIARSETKAYEMVESIVGIFGDEQLGNEAASSLGVIAEDEDGVLSKANGAVIRLLYKQRFFSFVLPKLVAGHEAASTNSQIQSVHLIALSHLLQHIPKQLTLTETPKLLPLLITALDLPDPSLRSNVIQTLTSLIQEPSLSSTFELSIPTIVSKLLSSTSTTNPPSTKAFVSLRLSILGFLKVLPDCVEYRILHPQKVAVLKMLSSSVDDPKRDVRREAVDCRSVWYGFGGA